MLYCDYHTHTTFSDGENTPEEMILEAIRRGMPELGISDHSYTAFDERYCIQKDRREEYRHELKELQEKYAGRILLRRGLEQDYWGEEPVEEPEYLIGSVHYVRCRGAYLAVDDGAEKLLGEVRDYFKGDIYAFCEAYYELVGGVAEKTGCQIIGHFDLVTKFMEKTQILDPEHPRDIAAWQQATDRLLSSGCLFEINTGARRRGYRTGPYPRPDILQYLQERGGRFILSGDSHSAAALCFEFERFADPDLPLALPGGSPGLLFRVPPAGKKQE